MTAHSEGEIGPFSTAAAEPEAVVPILERERLDSLDLLRGFAILGILLVNMQFFTMPIGTVLTIGPDDLASPLDKATWFFFKVLVEYKFVSMFSLLFGAGLIVQVLRSERQAGSFAMRYYRRMAALACFGLIHALLFWYGDILFMYAALGALVVLFRGLSARTLFITGACILAVTALFVATCVGVQHLKMAAMESASAASAAEQVQTGLRGFAAIREADFQFFHEAWIEAETAAFRDGPFAEALLFRVVLFAFTITFMLFGFGWHIFGMFLIGAGLMKAGFFSAPRVSWQKRMALLGVGVGLPIEVFSVILVINSETMIDRPMILHGFVHEIGSAALCLGYVGLGAWVASTLRSRALTWPIRAVGRMALTNYLGSTLIATFMMYHWGLGLFGSLRYSEQLIFAVGIYGGLIVASMAWMRLFRYGPFEWLWRWITYGRRPLLRRWGTGTAAGG